ncbi:expressed unknown protein [Seminavis robusta]|uniref:Uncharacterized protein n=1 Tax=Seminavis robusta TaxID=568900 RepID=A0A9N8HKZ3_9STRA|nr:expressed unknown protein [Seminavis robusta]|eukprot:Sro770_g199950.1 n/a (159) ;mRNA; f:19801-20277
MSSLLSSFLLEAFLDSFVIVQDNAKMQPQLLPKDLAQPTLSSSAAPPSCWESLSRGSKKKRPGKTRREQVGGKAISDNASARKSCPPRFPRRQISIDDDLATNEIHQRMDPPRFHQRRGSGDNELHPMILAKLMDIDTPACPMASSMGISIPTHATSA